MKDGLDTSVDQKHQRIVGDIHGALAHVDGLGQEGHITLHKNWVQLKQTSELETVHQLQDEVLRLLSCTAAAWLPDWSLVHSEQIVDQ